MPSSISNCFIYKCVTPPFPNSILSQRNESNPLSSCDNYGHVFRGCWKH
jgi:hypothetical protein